METRRGEGDARGPSPSPQGPQDASLRALGHTQRHDPSIPAASAPAQKAVASPLDSPQACSRKRPPALAEGVFATFLDQPAEKAGGASTRRRPPALASGAFATFLGEDAQPHGAESDAGWNVPSGGADGAGTSRQVPNCVSPHCEDAAETPTAAVAARPQLVEPLGIGALGPRGRRKSLVVKNMARSLSAHTGPGADYSRDTGRGKSRGRRGRGSGGRRGARQEKRL